MGFLASACQRNLSATSDPDFLFSPGRVGARISKWSISPVAAKLKPNLHRDVKGLETTKGRSQSEHNLLQPAKQNSLSLALFRP